MREARADILSNDVLSVANAICVTTNGVVKRNGRLTMGKGTA